MTAPTLRRGGYVTIPADAHLELRTTPLRDVALPDNHCAMDLDHIHALTRILRAGGRLPPPLLLQHEHGLWVVQGRHRYIAHAAAGLDHIYAVVTDRIEVVMQEPCPAG